MYFKIIIAPKDDDSQVDAFDAIEVAATDYDSQVDAILEIASIATILDVVELDLPGRSELALCKVS
jgi:hypothetical protein